MSTAKFATRDGTPPPIVSSRSAAACVRLLLPLSRRQSDAASTQNFDGVTQLSTDHIEMLSCVRCCALTRLARGMDGGREGEISTPGEAGPACGRGGPTDRRGAAVRTRALRDAVRSTKADRVLTSGRSSATRSKCLDRAEESDRSAVLGDAARGACIPVITRGGVPAALPVDGFVRWLKIHGRVDDASGRQ